MQRTRSVMKAIRARVFHVHGEEQVTGEGSAAQAGSRLQQRTQCQCSDLLTAAQSCPCADTHVPPNVSPISPSRRSHLQVYELIRSLSREVLIPAWFVLTGRDLQLGSPGESSLSLGTSLFPSHQLGFKRTLHCRGTSVLIVYPNPFYSEADCISTC